MCESTKSLKLVVLAALDADDEGNQHPAFDPRQVESEDRAVREARMMADRHAGVVAWSLKKSIRRRTTKAAAENIRPFGQRLMDANEPP